METNNRNSHGGKCVAPLELPVCDGRDRKSAKNRIINFMLRWLAFFGIFAGTTVCPFCGQPGCPVGAGSAAFAGGFFALFTQNWKVVISTVKNKMLRREND